MKHPLTRVHITQGFGGNAHLYRPYGLKGHSGIDYRTTHPDTPQGRRYVFAAKWGTVLEVGDQGNKGYGVFVRIRHFKDEETIYAHLTRAYVKRGDRVETSQRIGLSGNTGFSTAPHLHFGFRPWNWKTLINNGYSGYVDPSKFLENMDTEEKPKCTKCPVHCPK